MLVSTMAFQKVCSYLNEFQLSPRLALLENSSGKTFSFSYLSQVSRGISQKHIVQLEIFFY